MPVSEYHGIIRKEEIVSTDVSLPARRKTKRIKDIRCKALDRILRPGDNVLTMPEKSPKSKIQNPKSAIPNPISALGSAESWRTVSGPLERPIRLGVLISGGGTTLMNFIEQIAAGRLPAEVSLVIASRADCGGVARACKAGLNCEVVSRKAFAGVPEFSASIFGLCRTARVDLVLMAGFLALIEVPLDFELRVMNIHPALIPAFCGQGFYGHKVHDAVLESGVKVSGCTVHFADNHYDHGPIILQSCVDVYDDDTSDTLAARVFTAERRAYLEAIGLFAQGRLEVCGRRVRVGVRVAS